MALNFNDFQKVVETAQQSDAMKSDLKRALKKVNSSLEALQTAMGEMATVLTDDYVPAGPKARKPRAPKADAGSETGERKRPGRPKKTA